MTTTDPTQEEETKESGRMRKQWLRCGRYKKGYRSTRWVRQAIRQATRKQVRSVMFLQGFALTHPETEDLSVCVWHL